MTIKRFLCFFLLLVALLIVLLSIPAVADVSFSEGNLGDSQSVFIAGNPDLYPIEYYNRKTKRYEGVMPMLFEQISEATGIHFTYIYASSEDKQAYLAQNGQVDIVSAYISDQISADDISQDSALLSFFYDGITQTVAIGFTSVCDEAVKETILTHLEALSAEELTELTVSFVMSHEKESDAKLWIIWLGIVLVAFICIIALSLRLRKNQKKLLEQQNVNQQSCLYNRSYLDVILGSKIHDFVRKRYYAVCISANYENLIKYYGKDDSTALADYIARALQAEIQDREFGIHVDEKISFLFLMQAPNQEQAEIRVSALIKKLNWENGILNDDYLVTISAGCYGLSQMRESSERVIDIVTEAYLYAETNALSYFFVDSTFIKRVDRKALLQKETVQAVKKDQILFYLQYIVDIKKNVVIGAEALSRWEHPREGLLFPGAYIQLMQQAKNIHLLDFYMLEKCCQQLQRWNTPETEALKLSCNFDRQTAAREDFYDRVMEITEKYGVDRSRLVLEITEETFVYNKENVMRNTERLRETSFHVALDDFGSGSSYFQNLIEYHVSYLKLDRIFVRMMQTEPGEKLIRGIVTAAHELGLVVLQEGVETYDQLQKSRALGIDLVQGFVFSRVIPGIEGDRVRRRLFARLAEGDPPNALQTYADVNPDSEDDNVYEDDEEGNAFGTRYRWSFTARLHRAPEEIACYYSDLKNAFLKYKKVRSRISWSYDTISYKHAPVAKFVMRQKSLLVYLALPPAEFEESKYFFVDASEKKKYEQVPLRLKIRGSRGFKHALELVEELAKRLEWKEQADFSSQNYMLPCKSVEELIDKKLIKINGKAIGIDLLANSEEAQTQIPFEFTNFLDKNLNTEDSHMEENNMESNTSITQNIADFIYSTYYRWSFTARLHQAPENISAYYNEIKNAILRYKRVRSRVSWSCDTISFGKEQLVKFVLTQKTLYVYLALSPKDLEGTKYFFTDESSIKKYEKVPVRVRVRSERGVKYTLELIEKIAELKGLQLSKTFEETNYILPHESVEILLDRQLIKKIDLANPVTVSEEEAEEAAVAAAIVLEEPIVEDVPAIESVDEEQTPEESIPEALIPEALIPEALIPEALIPEAPVQEEPTAEEVPTEEASCADEIDVAQAPATMIEETPAEEIQNAELLEAESIHVNFLQKICQQFDADELNAHVKVVYKKKKEKKTSIFDIVMKKNRP